MSRLRLKKSRLQRQSAHYMMDETDIDFSFGYESYDSSFDPDPSQSDDIKRFKRDIKYNFLCLWELQRLIKHESIPTASTQSALESLSHDKFRAIISLGVQEYFEKTHDFDAVLQLRNKLIQVESNIGKDNLFTIHDKQQKSRYHESKHQTANGHKNKKAKKKKNKSYINCHKTFDKEDVVCKIFQYLDLRSLMQCSKVNINWLYCAYNPCSIYQLDIEETYTCETMDVDPCYDYYYSKPKPKRESPPAISHEYYTGFTKYFNHGRHISQYRNVSRIKLTQWNEGLQYYFQHLTKFNNIREMVIFTKNPFAMELDQGIYSDYYLNTVSKIIANNCNKIEKITIEEVDYMSESGSLSEAISKVMKAISEKIILPNLKEFIASDSTMDRFLCLSRNGKVVSNGLEKLSLQNVCVTNQFWKDLVDDKLNDLSNLKSLVLGKIQFWEEDWQSVMNVVLPKLAIKMIHLKHLECACDLYGFFMETIGLLLNLLLLKSKQSKFIQSYSFDNLCTLHFTLQNEKIFDMSDSLKLQKLANKIRFPQLKHITVEFKCALDCKPCQIDILLKMLLCNGEQDDLSTNCDCINNTVETISFAGVYQSKSVIHQVLLTLAEVHMTKLQKITLHQLVPSDIKSQQSVLEYLTCQMDTRIDMGKTIIQNK